MTVLQTKIYRFIFLSLFSNLGENPIFLLIAAKNENFWDLSYIKSVIPEKDTSIAVEDVTTTAVTTPEEGTHSHATPSVEDDYTK